MAWSLFCLFLIFGRSHSSNMCVEDHWTYAACGFNSDYTLNHASSRKKFLEIFKTHRLKDWCLTLMNSWGHAQVHIVTELLS